MESQSVHQISQCFITPKHTTEESKQPLYLSPSDIEMLSVNYIQKGLLYNKPSSANYTINPFLETLKEALSVTLTHYFPLAGRLATVHEENPHVYYVFVDCVNSPGAKFVHAKVELTVEDVLLPVDVPEVVKSFFNHDKMINHDGHSESLLTVQVTELVDGIFVGISVNHAVADGTSYWNFCNALSRACGNDGENPISSFPIHKRWFPENNKDGFINLPFTHHDQFTKRHPAPPLRERIFHFSPDSLSKLKSKANSLSNTTKISTLQALSAFVWICITRIRKLPLSENTNCRFPVNYRSRLNPPLSNNSFGNFVQLIGGSANVGDLLTGGTGQAAWNLHQIVSGHTDKIVRDSTNAWMNKPFIRQPGQSSYPNTILISSSPRFDMYGCEYGLGKGLAVLSGYANKYDGKITLFPGREGGGSMDLETCLSSECMNDLENDQEFMSFAS